MGGGTRRDGAEAMPVNRHKVRRFPSSLPTRLPPHPHKQVWIRQPQGPGPVHELYGAAGGTGAAQGRARPLRDQDP